MVTLSPLGSLWIGSPAGTGMSRRKRMLFAATDASQNVIESRGARFIGNF